MGLKFHKNLVMMLAAFLFFTCFPAVITAQEGSGRVIRSVFVPARYYVGDPVELRLLVEVPEGAELKTPPSFPVACNISIESIRILPSDEGREIRISFIPFQTGTCTLPPLDFGEIVLRDLRIHTSAILTDEGASLSEPEGQFFLPRTRLLMGGILAAIIFLPFVLLFLFRFSRRRILALFHRYRENRPYRRLSKNLKRLRQQTEDLDAREFYILLTAELRNYLTRRLGDNYSSATTMELASLMAGRSGNLDKLEDFLQMFRFSDLVKFGGKSADTERKLQDLELALRISREVEEQERGHAHL
ncbi:MAG: hypothetical protein K9L68_06075 [Spirochaetales bacterium]|nr:hypothetical protein [Spirochaetales bacterium]MCF7938149.1 hypothetical protein [Spirochaetales bacterium]